MLLRKQEGQFRLGLDEAQAVLQRELKHEALLSGTPRALFSFVGSGIQRLPGEGMLSPSERTLSSGRVGG